jgi:hypothetical protein
MDSNCWYVGDERFFNITVWSFICSIVWMVRRNARVVLQALGGDGKNGGQGESLIPEKKVPRISVGAGCGR